MFSQYYLYLKTRTQNLTVVIFVSLTLYPFYSIIYMDLLNVAEVDKFPSVLKQTKCNCLDHKHFSINSNYTWTNIVNIMGVKRSVFGSCEGKHVVVKKRLDPGKLRLNSIDDVTNVDILRLKAEIVLTTNLLPDPNKLALCPFSDNVGLFFKLLKSLNHVFNFTEYLEYFYIMQLSMEPIVQQMTKQWAVAEYLGNCGVFTISEYCGDSLTSVAPSLLWTERASIAVQLLEFAFNATFQHPDFSFYFTDMTADNFAVSSERKVKLVDLDNVIIVDKYPKDPPESWDTLHRNYHDDSDTGFAFSIEKICSHKISDMNVYSICQGILSERSDYIKGGLLHSPPKGSNVKSLIEECVSPPKESTRFDIARLIIDHLTEK